MAELPKSIPVEIAINQLAPEIPQVRVEEMVLDLTNPPVEPVSEIFIKTSSFAARIRKPRIFRESRNMIEPQDNRHRRRRGRGLCGACLVKAERGHNFGSKCTRRGMEKSDFGKKIDNQVTF